MPQQTSPSLPDIQDDPDFHALPLSEKHKALMAEDEDYRGLPPSEQAKYLDELHYGNLGQLTPDKGVKSTLWQDIKSAIPDTKNPHMIDLNRQAMEGYQARRGAGAGVPYSVAATALENTNPVGSFVSGMEQAGREGHPREVVGHALAGAAGVALPEAAHQLPIGEGVARTMRRPTGELRSGIKPVARVGGALAGGAAGQATGIPHAPWVGMGAGAAYAPKLIDAIIPERAAPRPRLVDEATREGQAEAMRLTDQVNKEGPRAKPAKESLATQIMRGGTSSAPGAVRPTEGPQPKPRMRAEDVKRAGINVGRLREDIEGEGGESAAPPKERLSAAMQRRVSEAEGRYDARRMAATGAERGEDSRTMPSEPSRAAEARPVSRKGQNLPVEDRLEQARRGAPGRNPAVRSLERKSLKRATKLENR